MKTIQYQIARALAGAFLSIFLIALSPAGSTAQQHAGIQGVDHLGINVPDLNKAVAFFSDVLGFTAVTQIGPIDLDAAWKATNHMQQGTGAVTIKMVRAGTGANIELFQYNNNKGSNLQPGGDDLGATHIAFYTSDIKAAVAYLKSKAVKVLGEPFLTPSGDTEGESWVYFLTPWGSKMELVSYPNGKGYEKKHPRTLLWSPKNNNTNNSQNQKTTTMTTTEIQALVNQHLVLWNERDSTKRNALAAEIYAPDIEMVDKHFTAVGTEKITFFINDLQQKNPAARFTHSQPIDAHSNIARLFWQFGPKDQPATVTGMDLFVIENGKISKLYVFVNENK